MPDFDINTLFALGGFVIAILGVVGTGWWRMTVMIKDARKEAADSVAAVGALASVARQEIAEHRLHVAQEYLTKTGMKEITEQIMEALGGLGAQLSEMRGRIDRAFDKPPTRSRA